MTRTKEQIAKEVEAEKAREGKANQKDVQAEKVKRQDQRLKGGRLVERKVLYRCFRRGEVGNGELAAILLGDQFFHDNFPKGGQWYQFNCTHWLKDINRNVERAVDIVATEYEKEGRYLRSLASGLPNDNEIMEDPAKELTKAQAKKKNQEKRTKWTKLSKAMSKKAGKLRDCKAINNTLKSSSAGDGSLGLNGATLIEPPLLFPCANTIVDLATGKEYRATPWKDLYFRQRSPVEYKGLNESAPLWDKTLDQVTCHRADLREYMEYGLGFAITGIQTKDMFCYYGPHGDNGKTLVSEIVDMCMGDFASTIPVELLLEEKFTKSSSGPREDLLQLRNKRLVTTSEAESKQYFSMSKIKQMTSDGDKIRARGVNAKDSVEFQQTHSFILHTNHIPQVKGADNAFFNRLRLIPFDARFVDDADEVDEEKFIYPKIPKKKLMEDFRAELPGILAHLVRCAVKAIELGHMPKAPECVRREVEDYKDTQDSYGPFFKACCDPAPEHMEQAKWLYLAWKKNHMEENELTDDKYVTKPRTFGTELKTRTDITHIPKDESGKGTVHYKGWKIKNEFRAEGDPSFPFSG
ncbi:MAG: hypothetical protein JEY79_05485 [Pseudodesulfovibrio sp.]|nr:hypothetical protein [Pseudodesulfovibrio sp.]